MEPLILQTVSSYREHLAGLLAKVGDERLDAVPAGCTASPRWQLVHMIATQARLTWGLAGRPCPLLSDEFLASGKGGATQEDFSLNEDYGTRHLLEMLAELPRQLQRDYKDLKKRKFTPFETFTGLLLHDLDAAIGFSAVHDGVHIGRIKAALRLLD